MLDQTAKKAVLRLFTYGLYAVTCAYDGDANVFTANWITQTSFDPPMVALSVENASASLPIILATGHRELAGVLGKPRARAGDKLAGHPHTTSPSGLPILDATLGYVECRVTGRLVTGDSTLIVGEVIGAVLQGEGEPLTMREAGFKHSG